LNLERMFFKRRDHMIKGIIFDFNWTIYDPEKDDLTEGAKELLDILRREGCKLCIVGKKTKEDRMKNFWI